MLTVMGATGHVGRKLVQKLVDAGAQVRALGRSEARLGELAAAGAETLAGDASDAAFLTRAFRGADGVYTLIPPDVQSPDYRAQQDRQGESVVSAIRDSGVRHVLFLSSLGGEIPAGTGPIAGLHAQEERLRALAGVNVLILRPAYFFENFNETLNLIRLHGIHGGAVAADLRMPMIATRDIADVAAEALLRRNWTGVVVRELLGERDLTMAEATRILGAAIGKPDLPYVQFWYDELRASLVQMGLSQSVADSYVELARALNDGKVQSIEGRKPENTTPTRFEDFAGEPARSYQLAEYQPEARLAEFT